MIEWQFIKETTKAGHGSVAAAGLVVEQLVLQGRAVVGGAELALQSLESAVGIFIFEGLEADGWAGRFSAAASGGQAERQRGHACSDPHGKQVLPCGYVVLLPERAWL